MIDNSEVYSIRLTCHHVYLRHCSYLRDISRYRCQVSLFWTLFMCLACTFQFTHVYYMKRDIYIYITWLQIDITYIVDDMVSVGDTVHGISIDPHWRLRSEKFAHELSGKLEASKVLGQELERVERVERLRQGVLQLGELFFLFFRLADMAILRGKII